MTTKKIKKMSYIIKYVVSQCMEMGPKGEKIDRL